jgi:hypothetical protein
VTLPPLYQQQMDVLKSPARFRVVVAGRRFGKTLLSVVACLQTALKGGRVWLVSPSYKQTMEAWAYLQRLVSQMPRSVAKTQIAELAVHFAGGGSIQARTGDNPDNLRGAGLDGVVLDEAATLKPEVWDLVLRPALADKQGWALFIGTPRHFNHFYDWYERGQSGDYPDWASWQHPTWTNPHIKPEEIEAAQRDMTPEDFDQEFGASFTAVGGAVFADLGRNRPAYLRPMPAGLDVLRTGVGMDWGTTPQHMAAVVCGQVLKTGAVWIRSAWQSDSGSSDLWREEAVRCKQDYGATFARVDRSQSSELDRLRAEGFSDVESGIAQVEARIGDFQGLVMRRAIYFDAAGPGVVDYYNRLCAYHRHPAGASKAGQVVEEEDDDVDAGCYLVSELLRRPTLLPGTPERRERRGSRPYDPRIVRKAV